MLATSYRHASSLRACIVGFAFALTLPLLGCGTGAYEERLEATVQAMRAGKAADAAGEASEPPAAPDGEKQISPIEEAINEARAAEAANASGQGVVGRTILAPTDAFP